ncbi:MAG: SUMF1/EgtB/PvdO family nonheme iron enzyme [Candidatus Methanoperedens sp.]|nr:SUMF1/EgtB/PvdO family nonheme iron enzyme [Candidatus Methanoperedens sp.]
MDNNNNLLHELFLIVIILIDTFLLYHYYDEFGIIIIISTVIIGLIVIKRKDFIKVVNDLLLKIKRIVEKLKGISQTKIPIWATTLIVFVVLVLVYIVYSRQPIASETFKIALMALSIIFHPVINSIALSSTTPNTGDAITVAVDVTDYASISSVTANGVVLAPNGSLWVGTIAAVKGTHTVDIIATDTLGQTTTDSSQSYTAPPRPSAGKNSVGIEFVHIPAGEFDMGSLQREAGRDEDEGQVHRVKIANAFNMSKYEITQKQWRDVMGTNPSYFKGDNLPVEQVSWNEVQEFISRLNQIEGINKYRLPSEAEWEYAARAGTYTRYYFGDNASKLGDYEWFIENSGIKTHEVGQKNHNPWGLYDMCGSVWEWVRDVYHDSYNGAPTDGSAWEGNGTHRVTRGGSFDYAAVHLRAANRNDRDPGYRHINTGFRLVMDS